MKLPLHETERVVIKTRAHARVLLQPLIMLLLLTGGCAFALGFLSRETLPGWLDTNTGVLSWMCLLLWLLLLMIWCVAPLWRWGRGWIALTTERIIFRSAVARGDLQSVGLFSVRDLVVHTRRKGSPQLPGTLDVLLHNGYVRISHVPAVAHFRELAIDVMRDAVANRPLGHRDGHPSGEGNNR